MIPIHPTEQAIEEAVDRIARTADGRDLYVFLQRRLMATPVSLKAGALRWDQGERSFAANLMSLMDKGILESGGRTGITGSTIGPDGREQPIIRPRAEPVRVSPARHPGGRRIGPDTRTAYDGPADGD